MLEGPTLIAYDKLRQEIFKLARFANMVYKPIVVYTLLIIGDDIFRTYKKVVRSSNFESWKQVMNSEI